VTTDTPAGAGNQAGAQAKIQGLTRALLQFMDEGVYPGEPEFQSYVVSAGPTDWPPVTDRLIEEARRRGLWNALLPVGASRGDLGEHDLAPLIEITGRSPFLATDALNLATPDSENIKLLDAYGTEEQRHEWLEPLLSGRIRSAYCMTEPDAAGSDPARLNTRIDIARNQVVVTGTKHWCTGAASPRCRLLVVVGVTDPDALRHRRLGLILIPIDAPGVHVEGHRSVFGYQDGHRGGRPTIRLDQVQMPRSALLGDPGDGFSLAQALLGPARLHHCMRLIGVGERALELLCLRALDRDVADGVLADQGVIQGWIADARIALVHIRALVRETAWHLDIGGDADIPTELSILKASTPVTVQRIVDRAIQAFGADGLSHELPLAMLWTYARTLRLSDGPDEVHRRVVARSELRRTRARKQ
jgi:acyl-CoA dehydrogenase